MATRDGTTTTSPSFTGTGSAASPVGHNRKIRHYVAVALVQLLHNAAFLFGFKMLVSDCELAKTFKKVKAVRDYVKLYRVEGLLHSLSVDTLRDVVAEMYGLKIEMYEVFASGYLVAGNVERYKDGRAVILVKSQQSQDVQRFVAAKELCHLMLDEEDDWSSSALDTLREMKTEFDMTAINGQGVQNPSRTQLSELMAMIAAIALLYPCDFHDSDRARVEADELSIARLALNHEMPAYAIEYAFLHPHVFGKYERLVAS